MSRLLARLSSASAALTRWERRHPFLSGVILAPTIAGGVWALALGLHAVFGV